MPVLLKMPAHEKNQEDRPGQWMEGRLGLPVNGRGKGN